jgi:hypothetical protein
MQSQNALGVFKDIFSVLSSTPLAKNPLVTFSKEQNRNELQVLYLKTDEEKAKERLAIGSRKLYKLDLLSMKLTSSDVGQKIRETTEKFKVLPFVIFSSPLLSLLKRCEQEATCTSFESMLAYGQVLDFLLHSEDDKLNSVFRKKTIAREFQINCAFAENKMVEEKLALVKCIYELTPEEAILRYQKIMRTLAVLLVNCMEFAAMDLIHLRLDTSLACLMTPHDQADVADLLMDSANALAFMKETHTILAINCAPAPTSDIYLVHEGMVLFVTSERERMNKKAIEVDVEKMEAIIAWATLCHEHFFEWEIEKMDKKPDAAMDITKE